MRMADYTHDGLQATFRMQVDSAPCGHRRFVAVGVTKERPYLHALGSKASPDQPLVLPEDVWKRLRHGRGPFDILIWPCGDHFAETRNPA
jgi:hypothetical protein